MAQEQRIGVTAFIFYDDQVLLLKRSTNENFLPGYFELPGGKLKFAEGPYSALKREIAEETGLTVKIIEPYSVFSYVSRNDTRHTVDIQFICIITEDDFEIKLSREHDEFKWVSEENIDNLKLSNEMKTAISKGFRAISE